MAGRFAGKVALVTGAGRSLGRAMAMGLAAEGARVAVLSRGQEGIDRTVGDIRAAGGTAIGIACDVFDLDRIDGAVAEVVAALGPVDILINNSWDQESAFAPMMDITVEGLRRQLDSGPVVYLKFMQACFPHMDGRDGRIINLASCIGTAGWSERGPYAMAKEAVRALTRTAAREWGSRRVTVNSLLPITDTDSYRQELERSGAPAPRPPVGYVGDPAADIVPLVLFLVSPEAGYFTGYSYYADGGSMIDAGR